MNYSQDFIDKVRDANNIVDIFSEYTQLKRSGNRLMGLCPFPGHNEKTPSFSVSEEKQVYHCFGCQRSGQIFHALKELKGLSFPDAIEYLANSAGIVLPESGTKQKVNSEARNKKEALFKVNKFAAQFFHAQLLKQESDHYAKAYCKKRKLSPELVKMFQIGFAENEWESLVNKLESVKAPLDLSAELGLIKKRKEADGFFDLFRDRLIFPIYSHKGECVGFGGRSFSSDQMPKYLNSPESEVFSKGSTIYGLNETAKYIHNEDSVVVVEGYMDFIALYAAGIRNVVATLGTALTPQHAKILKRYTSHVTILFDGDEAGQNAAKRSLPILLEQELLPKGILLQDELDPDEFIDQFGVETLKEKLKSAYDLFSIVLDRQLLNYRGSAADKVQLLDQMAEYVSGTKDLRLRDLYISEISQKIAVEDGWVRKHLQKPTLRANQAENRPSDGPITVPLSNDVPLEEAKIKLNGASKAELFLLNISLISEKRFEQIASQQISDHIFSEGVKEMFRKAEVRYRQMPNEFAKLSAYLMTLADTPKYLSWHLGEPLVSLNEEALDRLMNDCLRQVKERFLRNQTRELAASLKYLPSEDRQQKLEQIMNIQKSKMTLRRDRES